MCPGPPCIGRAQLGSTSILWTPSYFTAALWEAMRKCILTYVFPQSTFCIRPASSDHLMPCISLCHTYDLCSSLLQSASLGLLRRKQGGLLTTCSPAFGAAFDLEMCPFGVTETAWIPSGPGSSSDRLINPDSIGPGPHGTYFLVQITSGSMSKAPATSSK